MADLKRCLSRFCEPRSILPSLLLRSISPKYLVYRLRRLSNAYHLFTALFTAKSRSQENCRITRATLLYTFYSWLLAFYLRIRSMELVCRDIEIFLPYSTDTVFIHFQAISRIGTIAKSKLVNPFSF